MQLTFSVSSLSGHHMTTNVLTICKLSIKKSEEKIRTAVSINEVRSNPLSELRANVYKYHLSGSVGPSSPCKVGRHHVHWEFRVITRACHPQKTPTWSLKSSIKTEVVILNSSRWGPHLMSPWSTTLPRFPPWQWCSIYIYFVHYFKKEEVKLCWLEI